MLQILTMFVRIKTTPNSPRKSVQICESVREGDKVRQRIVRYVGIALDDKEQEALIQLARQIIVKLKEESSRSRTLFPPEVCDVLSQQAEAKENKRGLPIAEVRLSNLRQESQTITGIHDVFGKLFSDLGFDRIFSNEEDRHILKSLVLSRIARPASKRATAAFLEKDFGISLPLQKLYRMMDKLYPQIPTLKKIVLESTRKLFKDKIDIAFFDVTTLYFESTQEDELRSGYSKDQKYHGTPVILAMATTHDGLPVGYEIFPGNTAEVTTLISCLSSWKESFEIGKVVFVADRGLMSEQNLKMLEESGFEFIVAAKLRTMGKEVKAWVQSEEGHVISTISETSGLFWVKEHKLEGKRRLISSFNTQRAHKDAKDRIKILDKLRIKLAGGSTPGKLISNAGYKKFTSNSGGKTEICQKKLQEDASWDGIHGVITNSSAPATEILQAYRRLWVIEESFRITKHDLATRPIFHFTPERIASHFGICFIAFSLMRHAQYRIKLQHEPMSVQAIRNELLSVHASLLRDQTTGGLYKLPSSISNSALALYRVFGVPHSKIPQHL